MASNFRFTPYGEKVEWNAVEMDGVQATLRGRAVLGALQGRMLAARHVKTGALVKGITIRRETVLRGQYPVHDWIVDFVRANIGAIEYGSVKRPGLRIAHKTLRQMGG